MKTVKKFESFILEFKETEKNTPVLYRLSKKTQKSLASVMNLNLKH